MKPLRSNEKRLAWILGSLVIAIGSLFFLKHAFDAKDKFSKQKSLLIAQLQQARLLTQDAEDWNQRQQWISSHIPILSDDATAKLMDEISKKAKDLRISISQQKLLEPSEQNNYREVSIQLTAKASMENMMKWLSEVEQFEQFRYLKKLDLKKDEKGDMTANIVVAIKGKPAP